jgi:hypothetical protein
MPALSILIPTNRPGGLEHAARSLTRQTFTDFEVLVGSPFDPGPGPWRWIPDRHKGGFWTLNRCYNELFTAARAPLLVSLQDFIWVPPTGLERFVAAHARTGGIVTGISDQHVSIGLDGTLGPLHWRDVRRETYHGDELLPVIPNACEFNWACVPRAAVLDVGGMDEELDFIGFCGDALSLVMRLYAVALPFHIDPGNEVFAQRHGRVADWDAEHAVTTGRFDARTAALTAAGRWPRLNPRAASSAPPR